MASKNSGARFPTVKVTSPAPPETLQRIKKNKQVAFTYCREDLSPAGRRYPYNPNGSVEDIAGITSADGKVLGMMPHPERAMEFTNLYDWPLHKGADAAERGTYS